MSLSHLLGMSSMSTMNSCILSSRHQGECRVADWHAQLNNKMGGDLKKIQTVGDYMVEIWRAAGMEGIGTKVHSLSLIVQKPAPPPVLPVLPPLSLSEYGNGRAGFGIHHFT